MRTSRRVAAGVSALVVLTAACGKTVVVQDTSAPAPNSVATTTTVPTGTAAQLLRRLADQAQSLSIHIVSGGAGTAIAAIDALWQAAVIQLPHTEFRDNVAHQVDLLDTAVARRHPADADKAALHLQALVDSFAG